MTGGSLRLATASGVISSRLIDDRGGRGATLVTSQLPVDDWHAIVGDATFGDAILDRLTHHAHRITLTGGHSAAFPRRCLRRPTPNAVPCPRSAHPPIGFDRNA